MTSIASQLQAIKSALRGSADPLRHPFTRPSVLFDPKEAADIDLRSILPISLSGLEVLIELDSRFGRYRDTLFSHTSLEVDREKMAPKEEEKLNASIVSFLRLLSGHLHLPAALKTLEYLIRRYQVHVYNTEELILCALPYHDTHAFVRICQLIDLGNKKWAFLEGVKASGAPPPRKVIVQQCIRDKGVLETLCNYASPTKDFQQSRPVVCFCTAVVVEALGSIPKLDTDTVQRVLTFVFSGLNPAMGGSHDHKAGALMVVGLLATRATLASKLVQNLTFSIARMAQHDAKQSADLPWLRIVVMAIVSLAQSQSTQLLSKKTMMVLNEIRDFAGILAGLSQEFNIQKFLSLYVETLVDYSTTDESCCVTLSNTVENLPMKDVVDKIVNKVLAYCVKLSRSMDTSNLSEAGIWAKRILVIIDKHYPSERRIAVSKYLKSSIMNSREHESVFNAFCKIFDGDLDVATEISDSKIWFSLEHPKAVVRQSALSAMATSSILKDMAANPQKLRNIQYAILRRLHDDDLSVTQTALSIAGLSGIIDPPNLLNAYRDVLSKCTEIINKCKTNASQACDVAVSCLKHMVLDFGLQHSDYSQEIATMIFPLLLVVPKTWKVNFKALELLKHVKWPFLCDSSVKYESTYLEQMMSMHSGHFASINMKTIGALAETFAKDPQEHIQWLVKCCKNSELSKSFFLMILLQASVIHDEDCGSLLKLYMACSPALKDEWHRIESCGSAIPAEEINIEKFEKSFLGFAEQLFSTDIEALNIKILICIFWSLLKAYEKSVHHNTSVDDGEWLFMLDDMFLLFATSPLKTTFHKHLHFLARNCCKSPFQFLSKYFTEEGFSVEVQLGSLVLFASMCSMFAVSDHSSITENEHLQLLLGFPSLLIPLSNENKDIRSAAANCVEGLCKLWHSFDISRLKNGNDTMLARIIGTLTFADFMESIVSQKKLIISDVNFLPSYLASLLSLSSHNLLVPVNTSNRFDQPAKDAILLFILKSAVKFSPYGKADEILPLTPQLMMLSLLRGVGNIILHAEEVKSLLFGLLDRRNNYHFWLDKSHQELSTIEIKILCLLLEVSLSISGSAQVDADILDCLLKALKVNDLLSEDPAVVQPCVTVMQNLTSTLYKTLKTEIQDEVFGNLVVLFRSDNGYIRNGAREALLRIDIDSSTIARFLGLIVAQDHKIGSAKRLRIENFIIYPCLRHCEDSFDKVETRLSLLCSSLDILLLKKDIKKRDSLVQPLFHVLEELFSNDWLVSLISPGEKGGALSQVPETVTGALYHAQQATLSILKDLIDCVLLEPPLKDDIVDKFHINLLIGCARSTKDDTTRNHVFLLLSSVVKVSPKWLSEHTIDIFTVIGESAVKQIDSHSQRVLEGLISTLVPCWLSRTDSIEKLLQIFINALPEIAAHRRLTLIVYLLRTLGEKSSLGTLVAHLFHSMILRMHKSSSELGRNINELLSSSIILKEWEYVFAVQLCDQYSCKVWFPCLVKLLQHSRMQSEHEEQLYELYLSMEFIIEKLQDAELVFELEAGQDADHLQVTLVALMEQVVLNLQLAGVRSKQLSFPAGFVKQLKECARRVLKTITRWMVPSTYFRGITQLLGHPDGNVKKKTLRLLCESIKDHDSVQKKAKETKMMKQRPSLFSLYIDERDSTSFSEMCSNIVHLIGSSSDDSKIPVKHAAVSSVEVLSKEFPLDNAIYITCLACIVKHIASANLTISSSCLRTAGALIGVLQSKSLPQLPHVMKHVLERAHEISTCPIGKSRLGHIKMCDGILSSKMSVLMSVLTTLEAVVENLGGFLNPYLEDILDLVVLHPEYALEIDQKLNLKATSVRRLLTERIPVRLMLTPLLRIYSNALQCGESSLSLAFGMLASMIGGMDRSSIGSYHTKIYEQCLLALDLRRQHPESVKNINLVEESVIHTMIVLTLKLSETMFRPLFLHSLEWAESEIEASESTKRISIDRIISFYKLINQLIESHRSLLVPYFKYLLDGCTRYLTEDQDADSMALTHKRKKTKVVDTQRRAKGKGVLSPRQWHLRALILKSLYKCFLYDTTEQKLLDSSNFQVLLKPIVYQLLVEPPASLELSSDLPTVDEVDESLVLCLGQMAVTARSDVLWKPLNHEVLMQTRNERVRPKILGLKVVKYLVDHLKEEYLTFLAETIPFLGELLEDVELHVKSLAQEILKEMETLSGESLRQYL